MKQKQTGNWRFIIRTIAILFVVSWLLSGVLPAFFQSQLSSGNVALIQIKGTIISEKSTGLIGEQGTVASETIEAIKKADKNPNIKAILFEINSPGGSAVASSNIAAAIKNINKTSISLITEIGTSGAYWVASATDKIFANRMSVTGSIGVIGSYLEFSKLLERYNITYQRLVSGRYKDIGSPFKEMDFDEKIIMQSALQKIHTYFVEEVALNRNLSVDFINNLSNGLFYLGEESKELGLIDFIGNKEDAIKYLEIELNTTVKLAKYEKKRSLTDIFSKTISEKFFYIGKGIASSILAKERFSITT
ncbi:signal peptide peptidase SppA [Candidatus Woesearchaeota archaeon]|jgi:protease-4|nr:signal peptide peptidase SppA [Candidatus Woesearchaeota archaeon]